jgi:hypothetical protein
MYSLLLKKIELNDEVHAPAALLNKTPSTNYISGPGSGIATGYGLDSPGIEFRWG